jgi:hypothetical protein
VILGTHSAHYRPRGAHGGGVASNGCAARSPRSSPVRRLPAARSAILRPLSVSAAGARPTMLCALWRADRLAGRSLPRVLGPQARVRLRARRRRLRRPGAALRLRLEGARVAGAGRRGGRRHREHARASRCRGARLRPAGWRPQPEAGPSSGRAPGARARTAVGRPSGRCSRPGARAKASARAEPVGTAPKRRRRIPCGYARARVGRPHRRRVHHGIDGFRCSLRASSQRRAARRGRHLRSNGAQLESHH